jgi:hypothetical protein
MMSALDLRGDGATGTAEVPRPDADPGLVPAPPARLGPAPQRRYLTASSPWRVGHVVRAAVLVGLGLVGTLACYYGSSREVLLADQVGWILGALASAALFCLGMTFYLTAGFREVRRAARELTDDVSSLYPRSVTAAPSRADEAIDLTSLLDADELVAVPGMTRVHRRGCPLMRGKNAEPVGVAEIVNHVPCGVCLA